MIGGSVAFLLFLKPDVRRWRKQIVGACVVEAAIVVAPIAFVALDDATYVSTNCSFMGPASNGVGHLGWLYYAWGHGVAALLYQAVRIARYSPPEPDADAEPDVTGQPLD